MEEDIPHQSLSLLAGVAIDQDQISENILLQAPVEYVSNAEVIDGQHISKIVEVQYVTDEDSSQYYVSARKSHIYLDAERQNGRDPNNMGNIVFVHGNAMVQEQEISNHISMRKEEMLIHHRAGDLQNIYAKSESAEALTNGKCSLCNEAYNSKYLQDLFGEENQRRYLPELLNRYIHSPSIPLYKSKEYPICQLCVDTIFNWHSYYSKIKDVQRSYLSVAVAGQDEKESKSDNLKKSQLRTHFQRIGARKYRHTALQSQIQNTLYNSPYHHLVKRNLSEEDFENITQRLNSTKSNSSNKIKEIEHLVGDKGKILSIFCSDCGMSIIGGQENYKTHRSNCHNCDDLNQKLPCDLCGKYYPEKDSTGLSQSYFTHWLLHLYFHQCSTCEERFPNLSLLKKHEELHKNRPKFQCPLCDKILAKKVTLEKHIKTHLPDEERKKLAKPCHICGKIITAPTLKAHMYSVHSNERPWKCEICGSTFKHKSDLTGHRNAVHLKIKNFHCKICSRSFGHQCGLRTHMAKHENRREHECNVCCKKFITNWHLKKHLISHKTVKDIICQVCGKGFKKHDALQEHMTIHTGEKPYECHICGRKVRVLSNLYKHFLVHKKNKTYYSKTEASGNNSMSEMPSIIAPVSTNHSETVQEQHISSQPLEVIQTGRMEQANENLQLNRSKKVTYPGASLVAPSPVIVTKAPPVVIRHAEQVLNSVYSSSSNAQREVVDKNGILLSNKPKPPNTDEVWNQIYFHF